jgi:hypothetical protein
LLVGAGLRVAENALKAKPASLCGKQKPRGKHPIAPVTNILSLGDLPSLRIAENVLKAKPASLLRLCGKQEASGGFDPGLSNFTFRSDAPSSAEFFLLPTNLTSENKKMTASTYCPFSCSALLAPAFPPATAPTGSRSASS